MTKADRDRSIEELLRRALPSGDAPEAVCPDAETLAALADGTLISPLRREAEAHLADCHRCQALTAAMVRGDTLAHQAGVALPWWGNRGLLKWLAPAAAAATAVALMIAVPGWRTQLSETPRETAALPAPDSKQSTEVSPAAPAPAAASAAAAAPAPAREATSRDGLQAPADERDNLRARADGTGTRAEARKVDSPPAAAEAPPGVARAVPPEQMAAAAPQEAVGKAAQDRAARNERVAPEADRQLREQAAPATSAFADAVGALAAGFEVVSPDPRIRWRVSAAAVQQSMDGGATWAPQETAAGAPLAAGDSPTPAVCWLVGRAGTVLRTTDGGRQWNRVKFPESADLVGIVSATALSATVDLADGRRFATSDGGRTWAPLGR